MVELLIFYLKSNIDCKTYASNHKILNHFNKFKNYKYYNIDISSYSKVYNIINKHKPNIIINFAAETHVDRSIDMQAQRQKKI